MKILSMLILICGAMVLSGCCCSSGGGGSASGGTSAGCGGSSCNGSSRGSAMDPYFAGEVRYDPAASYNRTALPDRAQPVNCSCPF